MNRHLKIEFYTCKIALTGDLRDDLQVALKSSRKTQNVHWAGSFYFVLLQEGWDFGSKGGMRYKTSVSPSKREEEIENFKKRNVLTSHE